MTRKIHYLFLIFFFWQIFPATGDAGAQFIQSPYFEKAKSGEPLVVALTKNTPPFCLVDKNGVPHGFDVEIALGLGELLGTEIQFVYPDFQDIFGLIEDGSIDLAIANITITMERAMRVSFSHSYLDITQGALLDRRYIPRQIVEGVVGDVPIHSYSDLEKIPGLIVGTWGNTTSAALTEAFKLDLEHHTFDDILDAREALFSGEINALVADSPIIEFISNYYSADRKRFKTLTKPTTKERLAIAMRMGDPAFVGFLNEYVDELRADGTLDRWANQYVDNTSWAEEVLR
jgi:polar amino acid transport system substrate-binding protein